MITQQSYQENQTLFKTNHQCWPQSAQRHGFLQKIGTKQEFHCYVVEAGDSGTWSGVLYG